MYSIENDVHQILKQLKQRTQTIKLTEDVPQDLIYMTFLNQCADTEITPDIVMLGFEHSCKENKYLAQHYPEITKQVWMIAETGQGDTWFLDRTSLEVLFYDHDQGEYEAPEQFESMKINFAQFLQFAWLLRDHERLLDQYDQRKQVLSEQEYADLIQNIQCIHPDLLDNFPFQL